MIRAIRLVALCLLTFFMALSVAYGQYGTLLPLAGTMWFCLPSRVQQGVIDRLRSRKIAALRQELSRTNDKYQKAYEQWGAWQQEAQRWKATARRRAALGSHRLAVPTQADPQLLSELVQAGRRAVAMKYHPDHGGSTEMMQRVNATVEAVLHSR